LPGSRDRSSRVGFSWRALLHDSLLLDHPALRAVVPRRRGVARRTRHPGRSRHCLSLGPAVHAAADRGRPTLSAWRRGPLAGRRDRRGGRRPLARRRPGDRPVRPGHRRLHVASADARATRCCSSGLSVRQGGRRWRSSPMARRCLRSCWKSSHSGVASNRAVRQYPRRVRPRPPQVEAATDARPQRDHSARVVISGHGFVQNVRRGHYELGVQEPPRRRVAVAFAELALTI